MRKLLFSIAMSGVYAGAALAGPVVPAAGKQQTAATTAPGKAAPDAARPHVFTAHYDPCRPNGPDYYCQ